MCINFLAPLRPYEKNSWIRKVIMYRYGVKRILFIICYITCFYVEIELNVTTCDVLQTFYDNLIKNWKLARQSWLTKMKYNLKIISLIELLILKLFKSILHF